MELFHTSLVHGVNKLLIGKLAFDNGHVAPEQVVSGHRIIVNQPEFPGRMPLLLAWAGSLPTINRWLQGVVRRCCPPWQTRAEPVLR